MNELPLVMTVEEVAQALRVSRGSAYEAVRAGEIPSVRLGRSIRVPRHALEQLLDLPATNGDEGGELIEKHGPAASASASGRGDMSAALEP